MRLIKGFVYAAVVAALSAAGGCGGSNKDKPGDDAGIDAMTMPDAPLPGLVTVSFRRDGEGVVGARVGFLDATGALLSFTATDANGEASATMLPGGTVIVAPAISQGFQYVYAWVAVEPGDTLNIHHGAAPVTATNSVTFTIPTGDGSSYYGVRTSCSGGAVDTTPARTLPVDASCSQVDVYGWREDTTNYTFEGAIYKKGVAVSDGAAIDLTAEPVRNQTSTALQVTGIPAGVTSLFGAGMLLDGGFDLREYFEASGTPASGAATVTASLPGIPEVQMLSLIGFDDGDDAEVRAFQRGSVGPTSFALTGSLLPFVTDVSYDRATRAATWTGVGGDRGADAVFVDIEQLTHAWLILGPLPPAGVPFTLPALPAELADLAFDASQIEAEVSLLVAPGGHDALRSRIFTIENDYELATTEGIVVRSTGQFDEVLD
ncbi:MAG: hypothetical protein AB7O24_22875 [Kofleriaceae bacterium]